VIVRAALVVMVLAVAAPAAAQPLRLRGDALAGTAAPVGLLTLEGDGEATSWLDAEVSVWLGSAAGFDGRTGDPPGGADGDALIIALRGRSADGRAEARLGRLVVTAGALRPLHLDGTAGRLRLPHRFDVEAFAGIPVVPGMTSRTWDWAAGGRVARRLGDWGGAGVALLERRDAGRLAVRELGADASLAIGRADLAARLAHDLIGDGLASANLTLAARRGPLRGELFASHRSPSHLIPATSLFSVLGDVPSRGGGGRVSWRAAPRLDVLAEGGVRVVDGELGEDVTARATLRLDERGRGALIGELQRTGAAEGGWTGARVALRVPVAAAWTAAGEIEVVRPDEPGDRGTVWPWGLASLGWRRGLWDAAVAVEAGASPEHLRRVDGLIRVGRRWELR
jgi:hypothetical protein